MRPVFCLLVFSISLIWAAPTFAQNVFVTAGEHDAFTRIFLDAPEGMEWRLSANEDGYAFVANDAVTGFNLSRAFQRITTKRIRNLEPQDSTLLIKLACDCVADAYDWEDGNVVIDIADRPQGSRAKGTAPIVDPVFVDRLSLRTEIYDWSARISQDLSHVIPKRKTVPPDIAPPKDQPAPRLQVKFQPPYPIPDSHLPIGIGAHTGAFAVPVLPPAFTDSQVFFPVMKPDLPRQSEAQDFQDSLMRELQRAVSQGVVEVTPSELWQPARNVITGSQPSASKNSAQTGATNQNNIPATSQQIVVTTAPDAALAEVVHSMSDNVQSSTCLPTAWLDPAQWASGQPSAGFSGLRAQLLGEFDKPDPIAVLALARHYLYMGFGLEARRLVETFSVDAEQAELISELGHYLDGGAPRLAGILPSQVGCSPPATLWSILANPNGISDPDLDLRQILAAFSDLPVHLRGMIGPTLASSFSNAGKIDAAIGIRNLLDRSANADAESLNMIEAEIALAKDQEDAVMAPLDAVITNDGSQAALAMIKLIKEKRRLGQRIDPSLASAADALAVEYRGTDLGRQLTETAIRAFSTSGQPQTTFDRINEAQARRTVADETTRTLRIEAFYDAAVNSSNTAFVRLMHKEDFPTTEMPALKMRDQELTARISVAERLNRLGFFEKASDVLAPVAATASIETRRELARIAFARGQLDEALILIEDLNDTESEVLRVKVFLKQERYEQTLPILEQLGRTDQAAQIAWIAGDSARIAELDQRPIADVASYTPDLAGTSIFDSSDAEPLELGREMITSSQDLRQKILEHLN